MLNRMSFTNSDQPFFRAWAVYTPALPKGRLGLPTQMKMNSTELTPKELKKFFNENLNPALDTGYVQYIQETPRLSGYHQVDKFVCDSDKILLAQNPKRGTETPALVIEHGKAKSHLGTTKIHRDAGEDLVFDRIVKKLETLKKIKTTEKENEIIL